MEYYIWNYSSLLNYELVTFLSNNKMLPGRLMDNVVPTNAANDLKAPDETHSQKEFEEHQESMFENKHYSLWLSINFYF